ncbi:MAG: hypothetical protein PHT95_03010 [Candidatus Omnitrophica bacterium]|nr:hypothetical protein [Candidatus Omnitrophota bacterium]MDD4012815.1 hypothetical protein [Candidatus Omnitrophota bacterium]
MYFIKTIGFKGEPSSLFEGGFPRTLLFQMRFRTGGGKTKFLKKGDRLILYCARGSVSEFPRGGFIGSQRVLSGVRREMALFDEPWAYIADVQPEIFSIRKPISLKEVKKWEGLSEKLVVALKAELQALGGLCEIERTDYEKFFGEFRARNVF